MDRLADALAGKHSLKKDDYLFGIMHIPPKDRIRISQFDSRTQTDAFTVSAGGIPGVSIVAFRFYRVISSMSVLLSTT